VIMLLQCLCNISNISNRFDEAGKGEYLTTENQEPLSLRPWFTVYINRAETDQIQ